MSVNRASNGDGPACKDLQEAFIGRLDWKGDDFKGMQLECPGNVVDLCTYVLPQAEWNHAYEPEEIWKSMVSDAEMAADHFMEWARKSTATFSAITMPKLCFYKNIAIVIFHRLSVAGGAKMICYCGNPECAPKVNPWMFIAHST